MEEYSELENMRQQLDMLKAEVAKQKLVIDLNVRKMAVSHVSNLKNKFWWQVAICVFALVYCPWAFGELFNVSIWFNAVTVLFLAGALIFHIYSHVDLWNSNLNTNMADFSRRMVRIKRLNATWFKWGMIFIFPWLIWCIWELSNQSQYECQWIFIGISCLIGGLIGFAIGYRMYSKEQRELQKLVDQLEELTRE